MSERERLGPRWAALPARLRAAAPTALVAALCAAAPLASGAETALVASQAGLYRVGYASESAPIEINAIHSWRLHVETADGEPVANAEITLEGGMPAHDHGLPTRPQVTEYLGDGDYRVEGMRFHMRGDWEIAVTILAPPGRDVCRLTLTL